MELKEMIFALSRSLGPSGCERETAELAQQLLAPYVDRSEIDHLSNVVGYRAAANPGAKTILLDAHLDEVCMLVTGHHKGMLQFVSRGIDPRLLPGQDVILLTPERHRGVITCLPPHLLTAEEREKPFPKKMLRIDLGMTEEEAKKIPVGTRVCYATQPESLDGTRILGKSFDDRCCYAAIVRAMELLKDKPLPVNVVVLGSVQEETTGAGAAVGTYNTAPDAAIVVDVTFGGQLDVKKEAAKPLGSGVAIGISPLLHRRLSRALESCAKKHGIAHTLEIIPGNTGTNSMDTQIAREGVASTVLSVPLRYMHTPTEVIDVRDVEATAQLIAAFVLSAGEGELQ